MCVCVYIYISMTFTGGIVVKNLPVNAGDVRDACSVPGLGRFSWRRAWQPTPVFLPGESHGESSLASYSPWGCKVRHNWSDLAGTHAYDIWLGDVGGQRATSGRTKEFLEGEGVERALMKRLVTFWKYKWALRRIAGRCDSFCNNVFGCGANFFVSKQKIRILPLEGI